MENRGKIKIWEDMTESELLLLAKASKAEVPQELSGRLDSLVDRLEAEDKRNLIARSGRRGRIYAFAGFGLVAASIAAILLLRMPSVQPKDTFSSPEEAYAMLESTFSYIAGKTGVATNALGDSVQHIEDTFTNIYR